ncbi:MAG TPA: hypothetical protein VFT27_10930 [Actinomycetota bacterium]|nr:hypothetical protein [Actinomycetota bacterium]
MGGSERGGTIGKDRRSRLSPQTRTDLVGAALFLLLCGVTLAASRGDRSQLLLQLGGMAAALVVGRVLGWVHRAVIPAVVVVVALSVAIGSASSDERGALLGYDAAVVTLAVEGAIAAAMLVIGAIRLRWATVVAPRWPRPAIGAAAVVFVGVLATTIALGATYREDPDAVRVVPAERVALWHAALQILSERPVGVGPGRFDNVPPRFLPEGDVRWAEHDVLQQGAELGWAGVILTVLLFLWGFVRLWLHPEPDAYVVLGAVSLAVLGVAACTTHVLHVALVPIVTAALVGSAQAMTRRPIGGGSS